MFVFGVFYFFILIHLSTTDQSCVNSCVVESKFGAKLELPETCGKATKAKCSVLATFDYVNSVTVIEFGLNQRKQRSMDSNETEVTVNSVFSLEDKTFVRQAVEYFCSTGDRCELNFIEQQALPLYSQKKCDRFQSILYKNLVSEPVTTQRECFFNETIVTFCSEPCNLIYTNSTQIQRSCNDLVDLSFETFIGQSTPVNKPEYKDRSFSYGCSTPLCNGPAMQEQLKDSIENDRGECLILLNETMPISRGTKLENLTNHIFILLFFGGIFYYFFFLIN